MLIEGMDYTVRLVPWLSGDIPAMVTPDKDGHCSIYINENLSHEARLEALKHELRHIERDDFYNAAPIEAVEGLPVQQPAPPLKPYQYGVAVTFTPVDPEKLRQEAGSACG